MSRKIILLLIGAVSLMLVGCASTEKSAGCAGADKPACCGACPKAAACGKTCPVAAASCTYCPKEQKLMGQQGTVHCAKCNKDMPAGKWCSACNRIMLEGTVHCDKCNKDIPKGQYCAECKQYMGVPGVAYCNQCKKPYNESVGCPCCIK
ncbi:MAG: hypothetical protein GXY44_03270 [Phycisphaerales bacterium]|nr:hypothetical protein [Phycisphaerales bacterium]